MIAWCPDGAVFNPIQKLCMTSLYAIGPFSQDMKRSCENSRGSGSPDCAEDNWDIFFAGVLRGTSECPPGTKASATLSVCSDETYAYGPFTLSQVNNCRDLNWGFVCEVMRWPLGILRGEKAPAAPSINIAADASMRTQPNAVRGFRGKLLSFYTDPQNYKKVHTQVMGWFGTTSNACVAFMSTALRNAGLPVPRSLNSKGYNISTWTAALSEYLEFTVGWSRVTTLRDLSPGDIVFTLDIDGSRGTPAHVFLFVEWIDDASSWARVVDNQGFLHKRNLSSYNGGNFTPFQYALRAP